MTPPLPLDDRACYLLDTLRKLYDELGPDDWLVGASITALTPEGHLVTYGINEGNPEVTRFISDPAALADATPAIEAAFAGSVTDATIRDAP